LTLGKLQCYGGGDVPSRFGLLCVLLLPGVVPDGSFFGITVRSNARLLKTPDR
jgi:hypothetical protein